MISWTPAALVFYQRFCCFNPLQNTSHQGPLPNTEESLPNPAVVAIASTGRLNCPNHLSSCNNPCCDKINCICEASSDPPNGEQQKGASLLCCFKQILSNCDISSCCCCCMHSCCYSWLTGRRKRYFLLKWKIWIQTNDTFYLVLTKALNIFSLFFTDTIIKMSSVTLQLHHLLATTSPMALIPLQEVKMCSMWRPQRQMLQIPTQKIGLKLGLSIKLCFSTRHLLRLTIQGKSLNKSSVSK